jgi:O-antigen ligase
LLIKKLRLFRFLTIIASIIVIVLITSFNSTIKERNIDHTLNQLGISSNSDKIHIFSEKHENYYLTSWKMFIKNPITGIGPNNFRIECKKTEYESELDPCSTHPHNNYFQLLAELGAIGLILIFIIIYYFSKTILNQIYARLANKNFLSDYQICLFACILCSVWPFLPTMNLFNNWINIIYFLPIGFLLHTIYGKDNRTE